MSTGIDKTPGKAALAEAWPLHPSLQHPPRKQRRAFWGRGMRRELRRGALFLFPKFCRIYISAVGSELHGGKKKGNLSSTMGSVWLYPFVVNIKPIFKNLLWLSLYNDGRHHCVLIQYSEDASSVPGHLRTWGQGSEFSLEGLFFLPSWKGRPGGVRGWQSWGKCCGRASGQKSVIWSSSCGAVGSAASLERWDAGSIPTLAQWVKGSGVPSAATYVATVAWIWPLARELPMPWAAKTKKSLRFD